MKLLLYLWKIKKPAHLSCRFCALNKNFGYRRFKTCTLNLGADLFAGS